MMHTTRRTFVTGTALAAFPTVALPALALEPGPDAAASQAEPDPDLEGMAVMQIGGRRLLVDLTQPPQVGDEVVALVPQRGTRDRTLEIVRAGPREVDYALPHGVRSVFRRDRWCEAVGRVVGG
ncbi:hypothetical protein HNR56_000903 [Roseospira marina]|nr:hypothetical protein [Roseospira marina]MBB5086221.1 hypothetical protein [Roseospira marina]